MRTQKLRFFELAPLMNVGAVEETWKMDPAESWQPPSRGLQNRFRGLARYILIGLSASFLGICGCKNSGREAGRYLVAYDANCLPNLTLIDQHSHPVSLASLRGKPIVFDFIYTSCPGPCQLLTQHVVLIAKQLGPALGTKVRFVSVTIDPKHDSPSRLLNYAEAEGANLKGWYFLTGPLPQIEEVLARFRLQRQRESDGSIDHVLEYFLVNPDGRPVLQYIQNVDPSEVARDAQEAVSGNGLISTLIADLTRWI